MKKIQAIGFLAAGLLTTAPALKAATVYGLTSTNGLIRFDSALPGSITTIGTISGVSGSLVDLDFYPVNGLLYAFNGAGVGYTIDLSNGAATQVITPGAGLLGTVTDTDFNPSADRVRVYTTGGATENYRLVPDVNNSNPGASGTVVPDGNFSDAAAVLVASAYSNNFDGVVATSTTLYSIDTTANTLVSHSGTPTFNTITAVGPLGFDVGSAVGLDIQGADAFAYLTDGQSLYTVALASGTTIPLGTVGGSGLISIAVVPEPGTAVMGVLGLVSLMARRRRTA